MATAKENAKVLLKLGKDLRAIVELCEQIDEAERLAESVGYWKKQQEATAEEVKLLVAEGIKAQEAIADAKSEAVKVRKEANDYAKQRKENADRLAEEVLAKANAEASEAFGKAKEAIEELDKRCVAARDELDARQKELDALEVKIEKAKAAAQKLLKDVG